MDENNMSPELTLDAVPTLTLDPAAGEAAAAEEEKKVEPVMIEETRLSPEEQKMVDDFAEKIDVTNSQMVLQYGAATQKKIGDFSETALDKVRTKDLGETGEMIANLVTELKGFDAQEESKGIFGFFKKAGSGIEAMKAKYAKTEANVEKIEAVLEGHQVQLLKDVAMLDKMYQMNMLYFKELTMYILAGKKKLKQVREGELQAAMDKAKVSGLPEDAQAARDLADMCDRFEKKLYDLELTRNVSIQMGPQIRLIQNNDTMMAEKIQTSIVNTIPLWKSQMVLALGLAHSQRAIEAQRAVSDMTNELLKKNAAALKQGTIDAAKESERGIVDIETLQATNKSLIETLDELNKIQSEGRAKRAAAQGIFLPLRWLPTPIVNLTAFVVLMSILVCFVSNAFKVMLLSLLLLCAGAAAALRLLSKWLRKVHAPRNVHMVLVILLSFLFVWLLYRLIGTML